MPELTERFLDAKEAGKFLGASPKVLMKWARAGNLPAYPVGFGARRMWRFRLSELATWMEDQRANHQSAA